MKKVELMIFEVVKCSADYSGLTKMERLEKNIPSVFDKNNENILVLNDDQIEKLVEEVSFLKDSDFVESHGRKILWIDWMSEDQLNKVVDSLVKNMKKVEKIAKEIIANYGKTIMATQTIDGAEVELHASLGTKVLGENNLIMSMVR
jgi:hypothetical protein